MRTLQLPNDYALVMQQLDESGQEDFSNLAESLRFDRKRLAHILQSLRHKGLIQMSNTAEDAWVQLSSKGKRLVSYLWPETRLQHSF